MKAIKKSIILLISFAFCFGTYAQDILVKKDGSVLQIKTEEISETTIKYRLWSNQTGPLRSISIENVVSINYANGEIERFNNEVSTPNQPTQNAAQPTVPSQKEEEPMRPASVTIHVGTVVPIYTDFEFREADFYFYKTKTLCVALVEKDVIIDGVNVIPRNSEVYGHNEKKLNKGFGVELLYILTPDGRQIPVDGLLHMPKKAKVVGGPIKFRLKERNSICTIKEDVTFQLTD